MSLRCHAGSERHFGAVDKIATNAQKCDTIEEKRGGGGDATKDTHDNDRGFGAKRKLSAETGGSTGFVFRV